MRIEPTIESIPIAKIVVGVRRRSKLGNLRSLAKSIQMHGLIHPILLRNGHELVAGQRRLEAHRLLGLKTIRAIHVDKMTDTELRAIELDENVERLALASGEERKEHLARILQTEATLRAKAAEEAETGVSRSRGAKLSKRGRRGEGRPRRAGSLRDVAEATGVPEPTRRRLKQDVSYMERFPFLQRGGWIQSDVLKAGGLLDQIPADEHSSVASLVDRDGAPPHKVIQILTNLAEMPVATRNGIYQDVASGDPHVAVNAVAKAAQLPPLPDPAVVHLREATRDLEQAHKVCRVPSVSTKIGAVMTDVDRLRTRLIQETGGPA